MIEPTIVTWILAGFGSLIYLLLMVAQIQVLINSDSQKTKDLIIGKGEEWRDRTHLKSAKAFAWADWLVIFPLLISSNIGVLMGYTWGYSLWIALGAISVYFSILFWVLEKEYTYPSCGPLAYYTYYWGFYLYWGVAVIVYSFMKFL